MKRYFSILMVALLALNVPAQTRRTASKSAKTTRTQSGKTASAKSKTTTTKKNNSKKSTTQKGKTKVSDASKYSTTEIRGLQNQKSKLQKEIKQQEQKLRANQADVKKRLNQLLQINSEIDRHQKNIDGIQQDINHIDGNIDLLKAQLNTLEAQLAERKAKYLKSMRYMTRKHTVQDRLMFIFSAQNFAQMYRRMRFVREYASFQRAQGEMVKSKQLQVTDKQRQLEQVKGHKNNLLYKGQQERKALEGQQTEQQTVVNSLQKQQKTLQKIIDKQRKDAQAINAQIDKLVAIEVEKARVRAAEEAKRKAAAEAAAKKKREEELARKKAEAEKARLENERRLREAREQERKAKAEAKAAADREAAAKSREAAEAKERAAQAAREAEANRAAIERKAKEEEKRNRTEIDKAKEDVQRASTVSSVDRMMSGGFEANRGRLPMPITGSYRIVSHYGQNAIEGLKGVTLDNKGINILGSSGCQARAIYDGEVSAVFSYGGTTGVIVRHGIYLSVYCNLRSVSVHRGQKVSTRQVIGTVGEDNILQFQLRRDTAKLNPEQWLGR
jgi:murein hydrolase activator